MAEELKECSMHKIYFPDENNLFPATQDYFYKTNKNGLFPYCKECAKFKTKKWQKDNSEIYYAGIEKRNKNLKESQKQIMRNHAKMQRLNGYQKLYRQNNKEKFKKYRYERQHKNHKISAKEWKACKEYFNNQCAYCGLPIEEHYIIYKGERKLGDFHKEHVIHNGKNDLSNCVPSCKSCNSQKWEYKFEDWYNENNSVYGTERLNKIYRWLNEDYKSCIK
jgi:5-methylcytosine-specific restriction endonuclease McrA